MLHGTNTADVSRYRVDNSIIYDYSDEKATGFDEVVGDPKSGGLPLKVASFTLLAVRVIAP